MGKQSLNAAQALSVTTEPNTSEDQSFEDLGLEALIETWRRCYINEWTGQKLTYAKKGAMTRVDDHLRSFFLRQDEVTAPSHNALLAKGAIAVKREDVVPKKRYTSKYDKPPEEIVNYFSPRELTHIQMCRDLKDQVQSAGEICESPHMTPYCGYQWGDNAPYNFEEAYITLDNYVDDSNGDGINMQWKPTPFYIDLTFGILGQAYYAPKLFTDATVYSEAPEQEVSKLLAHEYMPSNPMYLHCLFSILDRLAGDHNYKHHHYKENLDTRPLYHWPLRAGCIQTLPNGQSLVKPEFYCYEPEPAPASILGLSVNGYNKYDGDNKSFNETIEPIIEELLLNIRTYQHKLEASTLPIDQQEQFKIIRALDTLKRALLQNEEFFSSVGNQYQYYYRYLYNAYTAYDDFLEIYKQVRNNEPFFNAILPKDVIKAVEGIQDQTLKKLLALTEIKLNKAWDDAVQHGKRINLSKTLGKNQIKKLQNTAAFSCMKKLFNSARWSFLQGKTANAVTYYQQHTDRMSQEDLEILKLFARHLLKKQSDKIKRDIGKQIIIMGAALIAVIESFNALTGQFGRLITGPVQAILVIECIHGFVKMGKKIDKLFDQLEQLKALEKELPLQELDKSIQKSIIKGTPILPILQEFAETQLQRLKEHSVANDEDIEEDAKAQLERQRPFSQYAHNSFFNQEEIDSLVQETKIGLGLQA